MPSSNQQRITIPSLTGGVSTQPEGQRFPNQSSECINANLDLVRGLEKRDGTSLKSSFTSLSITPENVVCLHWFNRDDDELYAMFITSSGLTVINVLEGTTCSVTDNTNGTYLAGVDGMMTVSDTTYAYNTQVEIETDPAVPSYSLTSTVAEWTDLTAPASEGLYAEVTDSTPGHPAGIYESIDEDGNLVWVRAATELADSSYLPTTMPVQIRCTAKDTFVVSEPRWNPRVSGDYVTNPPGSFVGNKINDMAYWAGRLWISAGQQLVGSTTEDLTNFWVLAFDAINDSDTIDLTVGSDTNLSSTHVIPYSNSMIIFTDASRQFEISSGDNGVVSPASTSLRESTAYPQPQATPVRLGNLLYFPTNGGGATRLYEYMMIDGAIPSAASDVAGHAYGYIPENCSRIVSIPETDQIIMQFGDNDLYVYQQSWAGEQKLQNAVFKWKFATSSDTLVSYTVVGSTLYILLERDGTWRVESMYTARSKDSQNQDNFDYPVSLDGKQSLAGTYADGRTTWTTVLPDEGTRLVVLGNQWSAISVTSRQSGSAVVIDKSGSFLEVQNDTSTTFSVQGDYSDYPVISGRDVDMSVQLSQQFVRDESGVPMDGTLQLKRMQVHYRSTGYFKVSITPPGRQLHYSEYTGKQVGLFSFASAGSLPETGTFPAKVLSSAAGVDIVLSSNNPSPVNIPYIEIFGGFVQNKPSTTRY